MNVILITLISVCLLQPGIKKMQRFSHDHYREISQLNALINHNHLDDFEYRNIVHSLENLTIISFYRKKIVAIFSGNIFV